MESIPAPPLCVACNGTVTPANLLQETLLSLLRTGSWRILLAPFWLLQGRAVFKSKLAEASQLNLDVLPINEDVLTMARAARQQGRRVVLVTGSDSSLAVKLSERLQVFDEVLASDPTRNLTGAAKASVLCERFGKHGYDFAGSSLRDFSVWENARKAILVTRSEQLISKVRTVTEIDHVIRTTKLRLADYVRMLRIHQWLKNMLVFVPALAAHRVTDPTVFFSACISFLAFGLCASSVYVLNDLLDLESDRQHPRKHKRPLAAARIPISQGLLIAPVLLLASLLIAGSLPFPFLAVLAGYFAVTLSYSLFLKRQVIVDVMLLAGLYTIRVIGGAAATHIKPSFWLLAFSIFIFLSLALVKRYAELDLSLRKNKTGGRLAGRGYVVEDLPVLLALGVASGFVAVLIIALYINNPDLLVTYPAPEWLWLIPGLLLYWVSRLWMKTHRGEMHDDPVVFTARDWQSLTVVSLSAACLLLASGWPG